MMDTLRRYYALILAAATMLAVTLLAKARFAERDTARATITDSLASLVARFINDLSLRFVLGVVFFVIAARLFRSFSQESADAKSTPPTARRLGFTRHWGGLGGGEGGWELEPEVLRSSVRLLAIVALSVTAAALLIPVGASSEANRTPVPPSSSTAPPGSAPASAPASTSAPPPASNTREVASATAAAGPRDSGAP